MISASRHLLASIETFQYHRARRGPWHRLMRKVARLRYLWWSFITHSDIEPRARLGKRLMLPHPNGVVIHEDAVVGDDCMIMQQVTIGMIGDGEVPTIGNGSLYWSRRENHRQGQGRRRRKDRRKRGGYQRCSVVRNCGGRARTSRRSRESLTGQAAWLMIVLTAPLTLSGTANSSIATIFRSAPSRPSWTTTSITERA